VSIYLVPGNQGRGLGAQILAAGSDWMRQHRDDVHTLIAEIRPENHSSIQAFKHAGYVAGSYTYQRSLRE
jgi:RimJ/RimL family protein N-acetyltransferase